MFELLQYRMWALSESYFSRIYPIVSDRLEKGSLDGLIKKQSMKDYWPRISALLNVAEGLPEVFGWNDELITAFYEVDPATQKVRLKTDEWTGELLIPTVKSGGKNIAILPIIGPVMKYDQACGPMGMQQLGMLINIIERTPDIHGLVLLMDTPGGTVDGTPELGLAISQMKKPVGVFGDGMVASAGVWLASQADVIIGNKNNPTSFGSIGTIYGKRDISNVIEAGRTPKVEIIRAPQSTEKALINDVEPLTDELRAEILGELRDITNQFIGIVKSGRGDKLDTAAEGLFKGRMFDVYKARQIGLIDGIGTLQTTINKVVELAKGQSKQGNSGATPTANSDMKYPILSKLFSGEAWNKVLSAFTEDQAPLEATEKVVAEKEAEIAKVRAELEEKATAIASLTASVAEKDSQIATLTSEKEALSAEVASVKEQLANAPTAPVVTVVPGKTESTQVNDPQVVAQKSKYRTSADDEADAYVNALYPTSKP